MIRHSDGSVTVTYKLEFTRGRKGHKRVVEAAPPAERPAIDPATVPRVTRMLVLGYHFELLVREGKVKNYAEIARMTGLTRARVTHLCNLTLLDPNTQSRILTLDKEYSVATLHEVDIRHLCTTVYWPRHGTH